MVVIFIGFKLVHELSRKEALIVLIIPFVLKVGFVVTAAVISESLLQLV